MANGNPPIYKLAPSVLQMAVKGKYGPKNVANVWHLRYTQTATVDQMAQAARAVSDAYQTRIMGGLSNNYTYVGLDWLNLTTIDSASGTIAANGALATVGAKTGAALSPNVAILIHKIAGTGSRKARNGRSYIVGLTEDTVDHNGDLVPAQVAGLELAFQAWRNDMDAITTGAVTWETVQPHWFQTNKPQDTVGGEWPATSVTYMDTVRLDMRAATQRRRLR